MRGNGARRTADDIVKLVLVKVGVEQDAVGDFPVSAGPPCLP